MKTTVTGLIIEAIKDTLTIVNSTLLSDAQKLLVLMDIKKDLPARQLVVHSNSRAVVISLLDERIQEYSDAIEAEPTSDSEPVKEVKKSNDPRPKAVSKRKPKPKRKTARKQGQADTGLSTE